MRMRYGQRGGDGPNTGKKAVTYVAVTPTGKVLTRRVFNNVPIDTDGNPLPACVAALLPPVNGYDWSIWFVAPSKDQTPRWFNSDSSVVFVDARIKTATDRVAKPRPEPEQHTVLTEKQMAARQAMDRINELRRRPGHRRSA